MNEWNNFVRKLKISTLIPVEFTEEESSLIDYIESEFENLVYFDYHTGKRYWFNNDKLIFILEHYKEERYASVRMFFYDTLKSVYNISHNNIEKILIFFFEHKGTDKISRINFGLHDGLRIEEIYKRSMSRP